MEIHAGIERWKATGWGVDPNQLAFRHYDNGRCECMSCRPGLHPVVETFADGRVEHFPTTHAQVESWRKAKPCDW